MHDQRLRRRHPVFHVSIYLPLTIGAALVFIAYAWFPGALPALMLTGIVVILGFGLPRWIGKGEREQRAQDAMDRELATWGFHGRDREGAWINYIDRPLVKQTDIARGKYFYGEWLAIHDGYIVVNPGRATVDGVAGQVTYHSDQPRTYAWDGCSPKLSFYWLALIGTPDWWQRIEPVQFVDAGGRLGSESVPKSMFWPKAHHASLVHDALYQYLGLIPISKVP